MGGLGSVWTAVLVCLCVVYLLLPIERGFPTIPLASGVPITATMLVTAISLILVLIKAPGFAVQVLRGTYGSIQLLMVACLCVTSVMAGEQVKSSMFMTLNYFLTFIGTYIILLYIFRLGGRGRLVVLIATCGAFAIAVGLVEAATGQYIPLYKSWFSTMNPYAVLHPGLRFRALGTLGNPILYAVSLATLVPFVLELRRRWIARVLMVGIVVAIGCAISTTAVMFLALFLVAGGVHNIARGRYGTVLFCSALFVGVAFGVSVAIASDETGDVGPYISRVIFGNPKSVQEREEATRVMIDASINIPNVTPFLFGNGLRSSSVALPGLMVTNTLFDPTADNIYVTVLYECGWIGITVYLIMNVVLLLRTRRSLTKNLHGYNYIGMLLCGFSFVTIYYATVNFAVIASLASLAHWEYEKRAAGRFALTAESRMMR